MRLLDLRGGVFLYCFSSEIPHFKEVIIMATNCDACGHRTNEVSLFLLEGESPRALLPVTA